MALTIYLACTVHRERRGVLAGRAVCDRLQALGHHVLTSHLLADDVEHAESALREEQVYTRDIEWLSRCDVLIAEASGSSYGVGFEGATFWDGHTRRVNASGFSTRRLDVTSSLA